MNRLRWTIHWADLEPIRGHEQAGRRPVLVVSREPFHVRSGLLTVLPLTTARRPARTWEVLLPAGAGGLPVDSLVLTAHIRTISSERLDPPALGRIVDPAVRRRIAEGLLLHLGFGDLERLALED